MALAGHGVDLDEELRRLPDNRFRETLSLTLTKQLLSALAFLRPCWAPTASA